MTIYVVWPKAIDADFRAFYPTVATGGETIQEQPFENATHFMVGTTRLGSQGVMALVAEFGDDVTFPEGYPSEFNGTFGD